MDIVSEFQKYLKSNTKLKDLSIKKYSQEVPRFIKSISNKNLYDYIYEDEINKLKSILFSIPAFIKADEKGNHMYSAGINHYIKFVKNESNIIFDLAIYQSLQDSPETRLKRLSKARTYPKSQSLTTKVYMRNPDVIAHRLFLAHGICEDCKNPAPFYRKSDNSPYLEVHHIVPLSQNGTDTLDNTVALCPNCHRKRHLG